MILRRLSQQKNYFASPNLTNDILIGQHTAIVGSDVLTNLQLNSRYRQIVVTAIIEYYRNANIDFAENDDNIAVLINDIYD